MLPERDVAAIKSYCEQRNDPETSDQLRVEAQVEPTAVTIVERRAPWGPDLGQEWTTVGVARLRYTATKREWTLQSADSSTYPSYMDSLDNATLSAEERLVLERFVDVLRVRLGDALVAVWLFGSRARGDAVAELSDVDVLVMVDRAGWGESGRVYEALHDAARGVSLANVAWSFSVHVHEPGWLQRRRPSNPSSSRRSTATTST